MTLETKKEWSEIKRNQVRYGSVFIFISAEQDGVHKQALPESQKEGVWLGDVM
jgi:hypothetical protein